MANKRTIFSCLQVVTMAGFVYRTKGDVPLPIMNAHTSVLATRNAAALTE